MIGLKFAYSGKAFRRPHFLYDLIQHTGHEWFNALKLHRNPACPVRSYLLSRYFFADGMVY
jgi:hypothetical protein